MVVNKFSHTVYVCIGVYAQFSKLHIKTNSVVFCVAKKADVQHQSSRHAAIMCHAAKKVWCMSINKKRRRMHFHGIALPTTFK